MKALYIGNRSIDISAKALEMNGAAIPHFMSTAMSFVAHESNTIPWQVFCTDKPKIDKRRSKRHHKKYMANLNKSASSIKIIDINNTLPNDDRHIKQLVEQIELKNELGAAISPAR